MVLTLDLPRSLLWDLKRVHERTIERLRLASRVDRVRVRVGIRLGDGNSELAQIVRLAVEHNVALVSILFRILNACCFQATKTF